MKHPSTARIGLVKHINTATILRIIREAGPVSRADITKQTGLNAATVSSNVLPLLELGIVKEIGSGESSGGRKPTLLELAPGSYCVIGVDMGTTGVSTAVTDLGANMIAEVRLPFGEGSGPDEVLDTIEASIQQVLDQPGISPDQVLGIGIGFHGLVNTEEGVSLFAPAFGWENIPVRERFASRFDLPVFIDNDVRAMALGEKWFGQAVQVTNFIFVNVGTGIGSGIYVNGELLRGSHYGAGEIGHITVADNGERCFCGKYGCLSTIASGPALEERMRRRIQAGTASLLTQMTEGRLPEITGKLIHEAALLGDEPARRLLDETGRYLGHAVSILVNLLNPELVIVGGGVAASGDLLFKGMHEAIQEKSLRNNVKGMAIRPTAFGGKAGIIGAATLVLQEIFSAPHLFTLKQES
ncbi:ROK family transcriptional regulator [Paenibacillus sp. y28]|uniref:ROK family transcriptional regulator n=1 Tax=Paenibacillus sp. y28 TaxID=3129110 RepID=UPI003018FDF8